MKLIGYFFERSDCALRNHELKNIINTFQSQVKRLYQPVNEYKDLIEEIAKNAGKCVNFADFKPLMVFQPKWIFNYGIKLTIWFWKKNLNYFQEISHDSISNPFNLSE